MSGWAAIRALKGTQLDLTVVQRENCHLSQPLLYQMATAELSLSDVAALSRAANAAPATVD